MGKLFLNSVQDHVRLSKTEMTRWKLQLSNKTLSVPLKKSEIRQQVILAHEGYIISDKIHGP